MMPAVSGWAQATLPGTLAKARSPAPYNEKVHNDLLPGQDLVEAGLADLHRGRESVSALLVCIGAPRLRRLGVHLPATIPSPELRLYDLLALDDPDSAHGRYNALIRRLVSYERAVECAR